MDSVSPKIIVVSQVEGRHRAGEVFSGTKQFPLDHFNAEQLRAIAADGQLTLVVGALFAGPEVERFIEASGLEKAEKAKKPGNAAKAT